jgi:hypothetical protein
MEIIELIIDENQELSGVDAISIVERPAIEENFVALSKQKEFKFESIDTDKRILIGALLIPDKKIPRRDGNREYYVYFSKETIRQAMELYAKRGYQNNATFEHREDVTGLTLVESWIKEDNNNDKSNIYGLDLPIGTWVGTVKVNNDVIWNDYIKTGIVKGFSIEGYFADLKHNNEEAELSKEIEAGLQLLTIKAELLKNIVKRDFKSYTDYPEEAKENAKIALRYAEQNGWGDCGTGVGKARANQLAKGEPITEDTISRMASFERHRQNSDKELGDGCGRLMWLAWGGDAGIEWASRKLEQIRNSKKKELAKNKISFDFDDTLSTSNGSELAKKLITEGNDIYIISARNSKEGILEKAKQLGISVNKVYATGSNKNKIDKIKELGINTHYDNNEDVIKELGKIGKIFKNER